MRVYNKHHNDAPYDAVYVGRPTKWGNPFTHLPDTKYGEYVMGGRAAAIKAYEMWMLMDNPLYEEAKRELRGKSLVCWCAPHACHADILLRIANE